VKWDATGANNGTSWTDAFTDLQNALAAAVSGDEIWVAAGTYKPTVGTDRYASFTLRNGVTIYGGFSGTETNLSQRNWLLNLTTLSGDIGTVGDNADNSYHVVVGSGTDATAVIDGFTVRDGRANAPYPQYWPHMHGAGLYTYGGNPTFRNLVVAYNTADNRGGAVVNQNSSPTFINVTFLGNYSPTYGGAMYNYRDNQPCNPTLINCVFSGNTDGNYEGGAVVNYNSEGTFVNVTFAGNTTPLAGGGAVANFNCNPQFHNCIFWGNTSPQIIGTCTVTYSDVQGGYAGTGNINVDPLLVDADGADNLVGTIDDDLALEATSPGIDAGNNAAVPGGITEDPRRQSRFVDVPAMLDVGSGTPPLVDMGAYEVQVLACDPDPAHISLSTPGQRTTIAFKYPGGGSSAVYGYSLKFSWTGSIVSTSTSSVTEGTFLSSQGTTQFFANSSGTNEITVDCALLGNQPGVSTAGTLFTVEFTGVAFGTSPVDITILSFRDNQNQTLTGFSEDDGEIQVDITNPVVTNVLIENLTMFPITGSNEYAKNTDNLKLTATVTDDYALGTSNIVANFSSLLVGGGTAVPAESYSGGVATWQTVLQNVNLTADGLKTVTVTATDGLGNTGSSSDDITVDNTLPTKVLGFAASPGHEKVNFTWTDASGNDANYRGVEIRYNEWNDYPVYGTSAPFYPANNLAGTFAIDVLSGHTGIHTFPDDHNPTPPPLYLHNDYRDIYYYGAFVHDLAGNYSAVDGGGQDRSTNYYLPDLGSGTGDIPGTTGYDGHVNAHDLFFFSRLYFATSATWGTIDPNGAESDFGPTAANKSYSAGHRLGIPTPDGVINFEDLMILAMNYGVVAPKLSAPADARPAKEFALELQGQVIGDEMLVTVHVANDGRSVKGTSILLRYDPMCLAVKDVTGGTLFGPLGQFAFFAHREEKGTVQMDAAALGVDRTVDYSGDIGTIRFKVLKSGETGLRFDGVKVRNRANEEVTIQTKLMEGASTTIPPPTAYDLAQNYPNPFNPATTIVYQVPEIAHVTLEVYNVLGERVATLVDEQQAAGYYRVEWNGKDSEQRSVSSGVYYCKILAGGFTGIKKMMLVK
jgi:hypothetical protein